MHTRTSHQLSEAANYIKSADGLLITAGAGMGVDSGLPDFRGDEGFWKAYPGLGREKIAFVDIASPAAFKRTPRKAWGFYGHRLNLYRQTVPHEGFKILHGISSNMANGSFVYTSNVDGQFQKAGFNESRIVECHGSIHYLQCLTVCTDRIWSAKDLHLVVDDATGLLESDVPRCPNCGGIARPNIMMFGDYTWIEDRTELQKSLLDLWLNKVKNPVVIELGAGTAIPSVRRKGESLSAPLIRINLDDSKAARPPSVSIKMPALEAMQALREMLL